MKKKAYVKNQIQIIKKTKARFLSIFCIVFLGAAFFAGLRHTALIMETTMNQYAQKHELNDLDYIATLGFKDEDIELVKQIDEVETVEAGYRFDALIQMKDKISGTVVYSNDSFKNKVNKVELVSGKLPTKDNQCLIDNNYALDYQLKVGDIITLKNDNGQKKFKIVGIVNDVRHISNIERGTNSLGDGTNVAFVEILSKGNESFALPKDLYDLRDGIVVNELRVTLKNPNNYNIFSDDYSNYVKDANKKIEKVLNKQINTLNDNLVGDAKTELAKGEQEYRDGLKQYEDGLIKYEDGKMLYEAGLVKYYDGYNQYLSGLIKYYDGKAQYDQGWNNYLMGKAQYDEGLAKYNSGKTVYDEAVKQYNKAQTWFDENKDKLSPEEAANYQKILDATKTGLDNTKAELDKNYALLQSTGSQLESARVTLIQTKATLDASKTQLDQTEKIFSQNKKQLDDTKLLLDNTKLSLDNAKVELTDAKTKLTDAKKAIRDIPTSKLITLSNEENASVLSFDAACQSMRAIAVVFPLIFFLVAALVSLTTMTRMVEEQRVQSGTFRALGYEKKDVINQYMIYAFLATFIASVLGIVAGVYFFPNIIYFLYRKMLFSVGAPIVIQFESFICIQTFVISVAITLLVTYLVVRQELSEMPASLLRPKAPKMGKRIVLERIDFIWKRLSFNQKVTMRNIFRYKKRFFMSVIGIAGCAALIVTGFGIKNSVSVLADKQYGEIFTYDGVIVYDKNLSDDELAKEQVELQKMDNVKDSTSFHREMITVAGEKDYYGTLEVFENSEQLDKYFNLESFETGEKLSLDDEGVIISAKLSELLDVKTGDNIKITIDERDYKVKVSGIMILYFQHHLYMSESLYEELTEDSTVNNYTYFNLDNPKQQTQITDYCKENTNIDSLNYVRGLSQAFRDQMGSIDSVVIILIACAGALAFIVLYNLTNINIQERKSEIATIKVLGFYPREVYDYVFRENTILSIIGSIVGLGLGKILHMFIINTVEVEVAMFIRTVNLMSYVYAVVITLIFTALIDFGMRKVLKNIDMVESLKSIE